MGTAHFVYSSFSIFAFFPLFSAFFCFFPSKIRYVLGYCITVNTFSSQDWCEVSTGAKISSQTKDFCRIIKWETIAEKLIDIWPLMVPPMPILKKFRDFCRNIFRNFNATGTTQYHNLWILKFWQKKFRNIYSNRTLVLPSAKISKFLNFRKKILNLAPSDIRLDSLSSTYLIFELGKFLICGKKAELEPEK